MIGKGDSAGSDMHIIDFLDVMETLAVVQAFVEEIAVCVVRRLVGSGVVGKEEAVEFPDAGDGLFDQLLRLCIRESGNLARIVRLGVHPLASVAPIVIAVAR